MSRRIALAVPALLLLIGCAGPAKLTERSEEKLAGGDHWKAWQFATRALDKEPGNPRAREAATAASASIAREWERRIHALADVDSVDAALQVLEFSEFRAGAARYATVPVSANWAEDEGAIRRAAARLHYKAGVIALQSSRPKKANLNFTEAERFVTPYRDAAKLAERAMEKALTRVVVLPFRSSADLAGMGPEVSNVWRSDLARQIAAPATRFTRLLGPEAVEQNMTVSQLRALSREDAVKLGRKAGAQRVVWGSLGGMHSETRLEFFRDVIARRVTVKDEAGRDVTKWVDVPFEVIARVRDVSVDVEYEVLSTRDGASVVRQHFNRGTSARVVWTSYQPEGSLDAYALVAETVASANPTRAKDVERRWKLACGEQTTLRQVLEARRTTRGSARYGRDALPRFIAGAAFVFLEDLPPAEDLAYAALASGCGPLAADLLRLDSVDEVDLGLAATNPDND